MADARGSVGRGCRGWALPGAVALLLLLPGLCLAQGLKLDTAKEKEADDFDKPNPHFELGCTECHGEKPAQNATWETVKFVNGEEGNVKLCYTCHDPSDNIHPINVDPKKGTPPVNVPKDFPLERVGPAKGTVVCSTCHFIHGPEALFLNYTNPMSTLTRALCMSRTVPRRTVGLCHEYLGVRRNLARLFKTSPEKIQARVAGINHLIWITDLYVEDRHVWDELPLLTAKLLDGIMEVDADDPSVFADHARVKSTLFQMYGALPAAVDRHIAEFFPHFLNKSTHWGTDFGLRLTSIADRIEMETEAKTLRPPSRAYFRWSLSCRMSPAKRPTRSSAPLCAVRNMQAC